MLYDTEGNPTEKYHLIFCNPDNEVFSRLSFNYARDQQFFILDQVGELVDKVLKFVGLLEKHPNHDISVTRDIQVHEFAYYKTECEYCDKENEICTVYFFTDAYMSDWYFKEHFEFLMGE